MRLALTSLLVLLASGCGILAANAYADCKTSAEEQGFVRRAP